MLCSLRRYISPARTLLHRQASRAPSGAAPAGDQVDISAKPLKRLDTGALWNTLRATTEGTLKGVLGQPEETALKGLLETVHQAGFRFYGGVSAEKSSEKSTSEMLKLLLKNPVDLRSKIWVAGTDEPKERLESALDLELLESICAAESPGMKGLLHFFEQGREVAGYDEQEEEWVPLGRFGAAHHLAEGVQVRFDAAEGYPRAESLEAAGAADYFYLSHDPATLEDPQLAGLVEQRVEEGFGFEFYSYPEQQAYLAAREQGDVPLEFEGVVVGTLQRPDTERKTFYHRWLEPVGAGSTAMEFIQNAEDWDLETRAEAYASIYKGAGEGDRPKYSYSFSPARETERHYQKIVEKGLEDPRPAARRLGALLSALGNGDSYNWVNYVLETLPDFRDEEKAEQHFQRSLAAASNGFEWPAALELADLGELDPCQHLAPATLARLGGARRRYEDYDNFERDYVALLSQSLTGAEPAESREFFFNILEICGDLGRPQEAGSLYRHFCRRAQGRDRLELLNSAELASELHAPELPYQKLKAYAATTYELENHWRWTEPAPVLEALTEPWTGTSYEERMALPERLRGIGPDRSDHHRDEDALGLLLSGLRRRVESGAGLDQAIFEADQALKEAEHWRHGLRDFGASSLVRVEHLEDAVVVGDVTLEIG